MGHPVNRQKMWKIENFFLISIANILQAGMMDAYRQLYWPKDNECSLKGSAAAFKPVVTLTDTQSGFFCLGVGKY